jgi:hypothetical protein
LRTIAAVLVLALAAAGCGGGEDEAAPDTDTVTVETAAGGTSGDAFEPYQCQPLIQASSRVRQAVLDSEPELLADLYALAFFFEDFGDDLSDELRQDFETVLEPFDAYLAAVAASGGSHDREALEGVVGGIDRERFGDASTRINAWANQGC